MSRSDFWIDSFSISRRHAVIRRRARGYFVEDLGSKNGTILDGVKLIKHREHLLPDKCKISFADHVYYFRSA
ncbi:MAG TPA: FHA domain-containing protein [Clostridiaceae bacterium]|nr:FHA domain-containing protein [Clostridiaceae bacterium]